MNNWFVYLSVFEELYDKVIAETIQDKKNPYLEFEILEDDYNLYDFFLSLDNQNINEKFITNCT